MDGYAMVMPQPGGDEGLEKRAVAIPDPGPGEARVRHTAIGLNFLDVYHRSGAYKWPVERDLAPGSEAAGVVEAVGADVTSVAPGDRVAHAVPPNACASARVIPASRLVKLPDGVAATVTLKGVTAQDLMRAVSRSFGPVAAVDSLTIFSGNLIDYFMDVGGTPSRIRAQSFAPARCGPGEQAVISTPRENRVVLED